MPIIFNKKQQVFHLKNEKVSYIIGIEKNRYLSHLYFGAPLTSYHRVNQAYLVERSFAPYFDPQDKNYATGTMLLENSTNGGGDYRVANYQIRNEAGQNFADFHYDSYKIYDGKKKIEGLPSIQGDKITSLEITLVEKNQQLEMILVYNLMEDLGVITRHTIFKNYSQNKVYLENAGSCLIDFPDSQYDFLHLYGSHASEAHPERFPLHRGIQEVNSLRGASSHQHHPFAALLKPETTEFSGEVFAFHFIYSGNFIIQAEVDQYETTRLQMGIHPDTFEWQLNPEETFETPEAVLNYSNEGLNGMSQNFHQLYLHYLSPKFWENKRRPVLLNTWEGNYFNFTEEELLQQSQVVKKAGIELFVLDDGWFGKRDSDHSSLGDWKSHKKKFSEGIIPFAKKINEEGLKFGLWFEPEMISPESELAKNHPDWAFHLKNETQYQSRNQWVLDLSRTDVQDYLIEMLRYYLSSGAIQYIKWDMNRHLSQVGNEIMPPLQQKELAHRHILGLYRILDTITTEFPEVLFENCSGGGGRFDPGMMAYMAQNWTSDNSDGPSRTFIQGGYSYLYPPVMMGAHVSAVPNHQLGRSASLATRSHIAFFGNFGYELDLSKLTPEEMEQVKKDVAFYQKHRELFQFGTFHRLENSWQGNSCAWLIQNEKEAMILYFNLLASPHRPLHYLKTKYLFNDALYENQETKEVFSGSELNQAGLLVSPYSQDFVTKIFHFKKV